jgi:hypothetical protein
MNVVSGRFETGLNKRRAREWINNHTLSVDRIEMTQLLLATLGTDNTECGFLGKIRVGTLACVPLTTTRYFWKERLKTVLQIPDGDDEWSLVRWRNVGQRPGDVDRLLEKTVNIWA